MLKLLLENYRQQKYHCSVFMVKMVEFEVGIEGKTERNETSNTRNNRFIASFFK